MSIKRLVKRLVKRLKSLRRHVNKYIDDYFHINDCDKKPYICKKRIRILNTCRSAEEVVSLHANLALLLIILSVISVSTLYFASWASGKEESIYGYLLISVFLIISSIIISRSQLGTFAWKFIIYIEDRMEKEKHFQIYIISKRLDRVNDELLDRKATITAVSQFL